MPFRSTALSPQIRWKCCDGELVYEAHNTL